MNKYHTYQVLDKTTGSVHSMLAKDGIEAREQLADMLEIAYDDTTLI